MLPWILSNHPALNFFLLNICQGSVPARASDSFELLQPGTLVSFLDRIKIINGIDFCQLNSVVSAALIIYLYPKGFQVAGLIIGQEESGRSWRFALSRLRQHEITAFAFNNRRGITLLMTHIFRAV